MKHELCNVYDQKGKFFTPPYAYRTSEQATRSFADAINDESSYMNPHPEDYTLQHIGTYDDNTGKIELFEITKTLATGVQCVKTTLSENFTPRIVKDEQANSSKQAEPSPT